MHWGDQTWEEMQYTGILVFGARTPPRCTPLLRCARRRRLSLLPAGLAAAQERALRIGNVTAQFGAPPPDFAPFTDYLSTFLDGRRFEVVPLDSIEQMVEMADAGQLDFVIASPVALVTLTHAAPRAARSPPSPRRRATACPPGWLGRCS